MGCLAHPDEVGSSRKQHRTRTEVIAVPRSPTLNERVLNPLSYVLLPISCLENNAYLRESPHIVSLHARATPETQGMIGKKQLAAMPAGSVLINCAGGTLVDSEALCDALDTDHLWGAGFDVFPEEPIPANSRLLRSPHIVMTPHIAGASKQTAEKAARIAAGEVRRFLQDEPLEHCVKPANERVDPYCVRVAGL